MSVNPDPVRLTTAASTRRSDAMSGNLLGIVSMLTWAAGFPAAEALSNSWPPVALITVRLALATCILVVVWALLEGPRRVLTARWGRGALVGSFSFGLGAYLLLQAQVLTDPVTVALIASSAPLAATLIELAQRSRRLTRRFCLGMALSVSGGIVATSALAPAQLGAGAACAVVSVFLFSWGSMATVRDFPELTPMGRSAITLGGGTMLMVVVLLGSALAGIDVLPAAALDGAQVSNLLIYALAGMALSQAMWIAAVGRLGVAMASFHLNVAPFYVMLILLALGAAWSWPQAIGALIVGCGVVIAQRA